MNEFFSESKTAA